MVKGSRLIAVSVEEPLDVEKGRFVVLHFDRLSFPIVDVDVVGISEAAVLLRDQLVLAHQWFEIRAKREDGPRCSCPSLTR